MLLQIIYESMDYFSYPINIKVDVNYDEQQTFPSISLCTKRRSLLTKTQIRDYYSDIFWKLNKLYTKYGCSAFVELSDKEIKRCEKDFYKYERDLSAILKEIRDRNTVNTTLEQLFDRTLHLNESIDCVIHYKNGKVVNCTQINGIVEYFDGLNQFGKCFTYFNDMREYTNNNNTSETFRNSEDFAEFRINFKNFIDILGNYHIYEQTFQVIIGVHQPNNFLSNSNFEVLPQIANNFDYEVVYSKMIFKSLEWPYSTDCRHYDNNNLYHSFENCMEYCSLLEQNSSFGCIIDPSGLSHFPVSDRKMNSNFKHIKICNFSMESPIRKCKKLCKNNCNEEFYRNDIINEKNINEHKQYLVRIKAKNTNIYEYSANPKYPFIIFATNIGSLMSLWLGISAIDLKVVLKILVKYLEKILLKLVSMGGLIQYFDRLINIMKKATIYLKKFKKIYLKKCINLFVLICFVYQSIVLLLEFTAFKTNIEVEMHSYCDERYKIKTENFPIISLCVDSSKSFTYFNNYNNTKFVTQYNTFEKILTNISESQKLYQKLNLLSIGEKNISHYLFWLKYSMPLNMRCLIDKSNVTTECIDKEDIIISESQQLGKCYTYLESPTLFDCNNEHQIESSKVFRIIAKLFSDENNTYSQSIHDRNQLPSFAFTETTTNNLTRYSLIKVKRLPPPHDSNCFNYKIDGLIKSRGHCINYCIINKILKKFDCIPVNLLQSLTLFENISLNSTFCSGKSFEFFEEENDCRNKCLKPCRESFFTIESYLIKGFYNPNEEKYIIYINTIYMTFNNFMISFGGLLGLWNNVSIYDLEQYLLKFFGNFICVKVMTNISKLMNLSIIKKLIELIKKYFGKINFKVTINK